MFECVINISEGRDAERLAALDSASGPSFAHRHSDPFHHRSVFTLINDADQLCADVQRLARKAVDLLDLRTHEGVHPRFGVVDVVPFVPLGARTLHEAAELRNETARWFARELAVPGYLYGDGVPAGTMSLPDVRQRARAGGAPDIPVDQLNPARGRVAVGARPVLVAWNVWLEGATLAEARSLARALRSPDVRALGLPVGAQVQVSCNLIRPLRTGPWTVLQRLDAALGPQVQRTRVELVGLAPQAVLDALTPDQRHACGLSPDLTIEAALAARGA